MLKYKGYTITFQEVPNEISLVVNVAGCPHHCPECHSQYLWTDDGAAPLFQNLYSLINPYAKMITCVCFMGGDWDKEGLIECLQYIKRNFPWLKLCVYSGEDTLKWIFSYLPLLDYVKVGSYQKDKGGLNNTGTNQRFYKVTGFYTEDITYLFWKKPYD